MGFDVQDFFVQVTVVIHVKSTLSSPDPWVPAALFILRFFLAIFLLQWSVEKLILPNAAGYRPQLLRGDTRSASIIRLIPSP